MQFVPSQRSGFFKFLISGYVFRKNKVTENAIYYLCIEKDVLPELLLMLERLKL